MIPAGPYAWLNAEPAPRMLLEAIKLFGIIEGPGQANNPTIMGWAAELGLERVYTADAVPWCGLFMALIAKRAAKPVPASPLWALNWAKWGVDGGQPELGDVLVFKRDGGGHVGLYVGEDHSAYHVLGGNESDRVTIIRIDKTRLYACRQFFATAKPGNVRPIILQSFGAPSVNEA